MEDLQIIAKQIFNIDCLKKEQLCIIDRFINNTDIFATLPTGFGKSICYQLPAIFTKKVIIIISPLIALMEDQAKCLKEKNINVICLNSLNKNKIQDIANIINNIDTNIIYTSPEYIVNNPEIISKLYDNNRLLGFAIDETHCVHQWSDNSFRPIYKEIANLRENINVPIMAVTASCTLKVRNEIIKMLKLSNPYLIKGSFYRNNLLINVFEKSKDIWFDIKNYIDNNKTIIIYVRTIKETEDLCILIRSKGYLCTYFHGSLTNNEKKIALDKFLNNKVNIIVATIAFGLGINKNIDTIIQYGMSNDLDSYYQEIGRGGRYSKECNCICFYSKKEIRVYNFFNSQIQDSDLKKHKYNELQKIIKYVSQDNECRWKIILTHFNEKFDKCDKCDICLQKINQTNKIEEIDIIDIIDETTKIYTMIFVDKIPINIICKMKNISMYELGLYIKKSIENNMKIDRKILGITDSILLNIKEEYKKNSDYIIIQNKFPKYNILQIIVSIELSKKNIIY